MKNGGSIIDGWRSLKIKVHIFISIITIKIMEQQRAYQIMESLSD